MGEPRIRKNNFLWALVVLILPNSAQLCSLPGDLRSLELGTII